MKLNITIEQCRQLYAKLIQDTSDIFNSSVSASETGIPYSAADIEDTWKIVENEVRNVYEMARFGLNITDLEDMHNINQFKGFCEDVDGIEPRNDDLLFKITRNITEMDEALGSIASSRALVPETLLEELNSYVNKKRAIYSSFLSGANQETEPEISGNDVEIENKINDLPEPEVVLNFVSETSKRLHRSQRILESVIEKTSESN